MVVKSSFIGHKKLIDSMVSTAMLQPNKDLIPHSKLIHWIDAPNLMR